MGMAVVVYPRNTQGICCHLSVASKPGNGSITDPNPKDPGRSIEF